MAAGAHLFVPATKHTIREYMILKCIRTHTRSIYTCMVPCERRPQSHARASGDDGFGRDAFITRQHTSSGAITGLQGGPSAGLYKATSTSSSSALSSRFSASCLWLSGRPTIDVIDLEENALSLVASLLLPFFSAPSLHPERAAAVPAAQAEGAERRENWLAITGAKDANSLARICHR